MGPVLEAISTSVQCQGRDDPECCTESRHIQRRDLQQHGFLGLTLNTFYLFSEEFGIWGIDVPQVCFTVEFVI